MIRLSFLILSLVTANAFAKVETNGPAPATSKLALDLQKYLSHPSQEAAIYCEIKPGQHYVLKLTPKGGSSPIAQFGTTGENVGLYMMQLQKQCPDGIIEIRPKGDPQVGSVQLPTDGNNAM